MYERKLEEEAAERAKLEAEKRRKLELLEEKERLIREQVRNDHASTIVWHMLYEEIRVFFLFNLLYFNTHQVLLTHYKLVTNKKYKS